MNITSKKKLLLIIILPLFFIPILVKKLEKRACLYEFEVERKRKELLDWGYTAASYLDANQINELYKSVSQN